MVERSLEGDPDYPRILAALDLLIPTTGQTVRHFAKIVRELSLRRRLMRLASACVDDLADISISIPDAVVCLVDEAREAVAFMDEKGAM